MGNMGKTALVIQMQEGLGGKKNKGGGFQTGVCVFVLDL